MALRESPYPNLALQALDIMGEGLLAPSFWALDHLLDLRPTTAEQQRQRLRCCGQCQGYAWRVLAGLAYVTLLLLALPTAVLGLLLWLPAQAARRPFAYQYTAGTMPAQPWDLQQHRCFTFLSANVCLLPSGLAKFSNLGQTSQRATFLAQHLAPNTAPDARASLVGPSHSDVNCYGGTLDGTVSQPPSSLALEMSTEEGEAVPTELREQFPRDSDFVCLQEVFEAGAANTLRQRLAGTYPHLLWDVGARGLRSGCLRVLGSGLLLASRYPLLAASYHAFPNGAHEDALAAKGVLLAQVLVGTTQGRRVVGYVGCTHLQAPAADVNVRQEQLTLALGWLQQFREQRGHREDLVAFDVFCGDLNFDNGSPGDALNQRHQLFEEYQDPCRRAAGHDEPWAIGTLLNYLKIYEEPVATPEKMKRTLSQPWGRRQFLAPPLLPGGHPEPSPQALWPGRRVDYILFRATRPLRTQKVAGVCFITQLATRSDHLPVALRLDVGPDAP